MAVPYPRVHVVINPASGKDEPILNTLNDVFHKAGVDWDVSITHKYGDAQAQARKAIEDGFDLVAGYGGDGTQHEIANAVLAMADATGKTTPMAVLPGGTGNGFCREMGVPGELRPAAEVIVSSTNTRRIDVARISSIADPQSADRYFIQRLYIGIEPEEQTSRELKDKYGVLAYPISMAARVAHPAHSEFHAEVDGQAFDFAASRVYVVNSGMTGSGLRVTKGYAVDDGLLDCFVIDAHNVGTMEAAAVRFLDMHAESAQRYFRQARSVSVTTKPQHAVWTDGEYVGRTPVSVEVVPGALTVVVP